MNTIITTKEINLDSKPERTKAAKPVFCITTGKIYASCTDAAHDLKCDLSNISLVCNCKQKTAKGMQFCFVKDMPAHVLEISNSMAENAKYAATYIRMENERKEKEERERKIQEYAQKIAKYRSELESLSEEYNALLVER